jgi:hypothetical protein
MSPLVSAEPEISRVRRLNVEPRGDQYLALLHAPSGAATGVVLGYKDPARNKNYFQSQGAGPQKGGLRIKALITTDRAMCSAIH